MTLPDVVRIQFDDCSLLAQGLIVGRLFVRPAFEGESSQDPEGRVKCEPQNWVVDVIDSATGIATCQTWDCALLIADEVSRNVPELEGAFTPWEIMRVIPPELREWIRTVQGLELVDGVELMSFREWRSIMGGKWIIHYPCARH